jgi:hypothetical protein
MTSTERADMLAKMCCDGYFDGLMAASPEPGSNRHPAYIHGFANGRDDAKIKTNLRTDKTAQERRCAWAYIMATEECGPC